MSPIFFFRFANSQTCRPGNARAYSEHWTSRILWKKYTNLRICELMNNIRSGGASNSTWASPGEIT